MGNDLISRSAVIEEFYKRVGGDFMVDDAEKIERVIMDVPVAYDTNKVVEQLWQRRILSKEKASEYDESGRLDLMDVYDAESEAYKDAIRIVKAGGAE